MKNPTHSISFKIWKTMVVTICLFIVVIFIINMTVITKYKEDITYHQLEEAFTTKYSRDELHDQKLTENEGILLISHMNILFDGDQQIIRLDKFTKSAFPGDEGQQVLEEIASQITLDTPANEQGKLRIGKLTYLYYVQWIEEGSAMVFFAAEHEKDDGLWSIFGLLVLLMIISFFASRHVARKLAKPIQELELFAEEIARRNWEVALPKTDNDEIGMLAKSLENMKNSLKIAEERDREFLQSSSHDLKTPVMIIKGYAQAMEDGVLIESEHSVAHIILAEANRLERRITQLLRLNTLGHSLEYKEGRKVIRLDRLIKSLVSHCKVVCPSLIWELDLKEIEIMGDAEALRIAFENIFDNQMRYATSTIRVTMTDSPTKKITIENDGKPFTVADPQILFDPYKKDAEGKFGLGLAIVAQVIHGHQGTISAYNTPLGVAYEINIE